MEESTTDGVKYMGDEIDDLLELVGAVAIGAAVGVGLAALLEALRKSKRR